MRWVAAIREDAQVRAQVLCAFLALFLLIYTLVIGDRLPSENSSSQTTASSLHPTKNVQWLSRISPGPDNALLLRPLFSSSRQPWSAPVAAVAIPSHVMPAQLLPPPRVKLVGIIAGIDHKLAILLDDPGTRSRVVREGDRLDGWMVVTIGRRDIVLQQGGQHTSLTFPHGRQTSR